MSHRESDEPHIKYSCPRIAGFHHLSKIIACKEVTEGLKWILLKLIPAWLKSPKADSLFAPIPKPLSPWKLNIKRSIFFQYHLSPIVIYNRISSSEKKCNMLESRTKSDSYGQEMPSYADKFGDILQKWPNYDWACWWCFYQEDLMLTGCVDLFYSYCINILISINSYHWVSFHTFKHHEFFPWVILVKFKWSYDV